MKPYFCQVNNPEMNSIPVSAETPIVELLKPERMSMATPRAAYDATLAVKAKYLDMQTSWWELGSMVRRCLELQVPAALGKSVIQWLKECVGESVSKVYRSICIVKALEGLPLDSVKQLTEGNAFKLSSLPAEKRGEWLQKALTLKNKDFKVAVDQELGKHGPQHRDVYVDLFPRMPETLRELFQTLETRLARILEEDIELYPGKKAIVWERAVVLLFNTPDDVLRESMSGEGE